MQLAARVLGRLHRLVVPLEEPLGVGERAALLGVRRRRKEEHLGLDVLRLGLVTVELRPLAPELRGLGEDEIAHDHPFELAHALPLERAVHRADHRVLAHDEVALHLPVGHLAHRGEVRVVTGEVGEILEAETVLLGGVLAVPGLEQGDRVLGQLAPPAEVRDVAGEVLLEVLGVLRLRHRQVAGEHVVQRGDVRRTLDGGVAAEREDPPSRSADVPQEELEDAGRADVLHAHRVVRPADRVADGAGLLPARAVAQDLGDAGELLRRDPAGALDHLRRVAREVTPHDLEDAARVLQGHVELGVQEIVRAVPDLSGARLGGDLLVARSGDDVDALVLPALHVVLAQLLVVSAEETGEIVGVTERLVDEGGRVGEVDDVLLEVAPVLDHVADQAAEKGDVRPRADLDVLVGDGARAGEARVDVDDLRATALGLHHPAETHRVTLGHVRPFD